jgi:uncharacterized protein (TIGR02246 family)
MNKILQRIGLAALVLALGLPARAAVDTAAIEKLAADFSAAWAKDDTKAMAAFWTEDGDLLNPFGRWAKGRAEVEKLFQDEHTGPLKATTNTLKLIGSRELAPDVVLADWTTDLNGVKGPDGAAVPAIHHNVTTVLMKKDGQWHIVSLRVMLPAPPLGPPAK